MKRSYDDGGMLVITAVLAQYEEDPRSTIHYYYAVKKSTDWPQMKDTEHKKNLKFK